MRCITCAGRWKKRAVPRGVHAQTDHVPGDPRAAAARLRGIASEVRAQGKALHAVAQDALRQGFVNERQVERLLESYQELLITAKRLV